MKEVSCRIFAVFFKPLAAKGVDPAVMIEGTTVTLAHLKGKQERVDWSECCAIMKNLRPHFTDAEYREIGRSYFRSPGLRFAFVVARLLLTPMGFYRWLNKPRDGAGNQMFTCITPTHRDISDQECEVDLLLADGFEMCWEFFTITVGNFEEMPRLLGYPAAKVDLTRLPNGARFHMTVAKRRSLFGRILGVLTWPFTVRAAARELQEAHESLRDRFDELQAAQRVAERQRALLDTAYKVGQRIWSERDPATTATVIAEALVEVAHYAGAALEISPADEPGKTEHAASGTPDLSAALRLDLSRRGRLTGEMRVIPRAGADSAEAQTLLDLLAPTIAIALDNAFAYRELADYQKGLEAKVESRTTELRQARDSLADTVSALEQARDARERIFANISHEIRTPLTLILLAVRDIESRSALDEPSRNLMRSIEGSARKLLRLVDELLLLAAGEAQSLRLRPEAVDLTPLVAALGTTWRPAVENAGIELIVDAGQPCAAVADPVAVERIVSNLLSNAVKYTPRGGRITLRVEHVGAVVAISVRDTGVGIPDELLGRLFGRFEQGQGPAQVRGGSGIGLSLVKELAQAMGGNVEVERVRAGGTEFRVTLPSTTAPTVATGALTLRPADFGHVIAAIASGDIFTPASKQGATVLVAEDDPALALSIATMLAEDYIVVVALDGAAALELAIRHQPHLLVTDIEMPHMDGVELTRRFRALPGNGLAPVVMLSALADLKDRISGLDAGAVDYVVKPFDPRELKARVRAQLEMRNLALRLHRAEQLASLGTLSAGLAHELRNPANGIVNAIGPLRELLPPELMHPDAAPAQLLDVLSGCAEQIASLSKQLLGFRRGGELDLRTVPLGDVVHRALSLIGPSLRGIELRDHSVAATEIRCAPPLLVQVVTNLVENAAQAAGKGGWVEIVSRAGGGRVVVEVSDSGPGVPRELRERIFEPFFTTKAPGVGTGLGLPVARDIVHRHGGILEIRERGDRPIFVIDLPSRSSAPEPS